MEGLDEIDAPGLYTANTCDIPISHIRPVKIETTHKLMNFSE